jgi:hypothetical protein
VIEAKRVRWTILSLLLVVTVAACLYPADEPDVHVPRAARPARTASTPAPALTAAAIESDLVDVDPFTARGWREEPPPAPVAPVPAPVPEPFVGPIRPPPPPAPPALPFQFMGRLNDGDVPVVYLTHGDQTLIARTGETLEKTYKVLSMSALQVEFLYLPTGDKQLMSLPAPGN